MAKVKMTEGKLYPFAAIDRTSKVAVTQFVEDARRPPAL